MLIVKNLFAWKNQNNDLLFESRYTIEFRFELLLVMIFLAYFLLMFI